MKRIEFYTPEPDGTCRTIKANYWKTSRANFLHTNSWGATGVIEYEDEDEQSNKPT